MTAPHHGAGETAVTTLALIVHELATNSIKYGALSVDDGMVDLTCDVDDGSMVMVWKELRGPPTVAPGAPLGFGRKLLAKSVTGQFRGSIAFDSPPEGVVITMRMSEARLAA